MADQWAMMRQPMPNPEDPWHGMREVGNTPFAQAAAAVARSPATPGVPTPREFNPLLDPKRSGIFGLIGRLTGQPSEEAAQIEGIGAARAKAYSFMQQQMEGGDVGPQQAFMNFINTPEGMDFFMKDPDPTTAMTEFMKMTAKPDPEKGQIVGPGQALVGEQSGQVMYQQPTTAEQEFEYKARVARMGDTERASVMRAQMQADATGDVTDKQQAANNLVRKGIWTQDFADMWMAGGVQFFPSEDMAGGTNGTNMILNPGTPDMKSIFIPNNAALRGDATDGGIPENKPAPPASAQPVSPSPKLGSTLQPFEADPADIVRGAGTAAATARGFGNFAAEWLDPSYSPDTLNNAKTALDTIRFDAMNMKTSHRLASDQKILDNIINTMNWTDTPQSVAYTLINWNNFLDKRYSAAAAKSVDPGTSSQVRAEATAEMADIEKARLNVPTNEALMAKIEQLKGEEAPMVELGKKAVSGAGDVLGKAKEAVTAVEGGGEPEAPKPAGPQGAPPAGKNLRNPQKYPKPSGTVKGQPVYETELDAKAAAKRGEYGPGDTIIVNGEPVQILSRKKQ